MQLLADWMRRLGVFSSWVHARSLVNPAVFTVLNYHAVGKVSESYLFDSDVVDATEENLELQLGYIAKHFNIIDIDTLLRAMRGDGSLLSRSLLITFDDGYRSNFEIALPALLRHGLKAAFFIATEYVERRTIYWWDRINYLIKSSKEKEIQLQYPFSVRLRLESDPQGSIETLMDVVKKHPGLDLDRFLTEITEASRVDWSQGLENRLAEQLIMTWDEIRALRDAGMDVESHTRSHRVLQTLDPKELRKELIGSRTDLENRLGKPVQAVAYPVGWPVSNDPQLRRILSEAGYEAGFTCASGLNSNWHHMDRYDIKRLSVGRLTNFNVFCAQLVIPSISYRLP